MAARIRSLGDVHAGGVRPAGGRLVSRQECGDDVAEECVKTINEERFLVLPHPVVEKYIQYKTSDYDGWLAGMSKLNERFRY